MEPLWPILMLALIGTLLIAVDFFLPGFVLGSIGCVVMLFAVFQAYEAYGATVAGVVFTLQAAIGMGIGYYTVRYGPETALGRRMVLSHSQTQQRASPDESPDLVGQLGTAATVLRPSGLGLFEGKRLDVMAESGIIERGSPIEVVAVNGTRIIVRTIQETKTS